MSIARGVQKAKLAKATLSASMSKRGKILHLFGLAWIMNGVGIFLVPSPHQYLLLDVGSGPRALLWIATGAIAISLGGRMRSGYRWGFAVLYIPAAYRWLAYLYGVIDYFDRAHGREGDLRGIVGVLTWGIILVTIRVLAGPDDPQEHDEGRR